MNELNDFIEISKYTGERYDLIQAGGGNTSCKTDDGKMYIKASGVYLSDVSENQGYSVVEYKKLLNIFEEKNIIREGNKKLKDKLSSEYINKYNLTPALRPSIETLLHILMKKYTIHSHPIVVNSITLRKDWKEILKEIFKNDKIALAEYKTPGLELALELKKIINDDDIPQIIFLQNHGLIVTSDKKSEVIDLTEYAVNKIEEYLNIDMSKYKNTNKISRWVNNNYENITYLSQDEYINSLKQDKLLLTTYPFCPDKMVYCGIKTIILKDNPKKEIEEYKEKYYDIPKIAVYENNIYFIAKSIKKAKEIEDVFKFHLMALNLAKGKEVNFLTEEEIKYIGNWEAEKYRQKLGEKICK